MSTEEPSEECEYVEECECDSPESASCLCTCGCGCICVQRIVPVISDFPPYDGTSPQPRPTNPVIVDYPLNNTFPIITTFTTTTFTTTVTTTIAPVNEFIPKCDDKSSCNRLGF